MKIVSIARDGTEIGEFEISMVQAGLRSHFFNKKDYAWMDGLTEWLPITDFLKEYGAKEPATEKQFELLESLGIEIPDNVTFRVASELITEARQAKEVEEYRRNEAAQQSVLPLAPEDGWENPPHNKIRVCKDRRDIGWIGIGEVRKRLKTRELLKSDFFFDFDNVIWITLDNL